MRKMIIAITMAVVLMFGSVAGATPGGTSQIPENMRVESAYNVDGSVYRVFFVEELYGNQYRYFAGPWFNVDSAQRAATKLSDVETVIDKSIRIQVLAPGQDSWQNFAQ